MRMSTEYLMKCDEIRIYFPGDSTSTLQYQACYIAKKDDMIILIKSKDILDRIMKNIESTRSSDDFQDFGVPTSSKDLHFDTLLGKKGVELFVGYSNIRIRF